MSLIVLGLNILLCLTVARVLGVLIPYQYCRMCHGTSNISRCVQIQHCSHTQVHSCYLQVYRDYGDIEIHAGCATEDDCGKVHHRVTSEIANVTYLGTRNHQLLCGGCCQGPYNCNRFICRHLTFTTTQQPSTLAPHVHAHNPRPHSMISTTLVPSAHVTSSTARPSSQFRRTSTHSPAVNSDRKCAVFKGDTTLSAYLNHPPAVCSDSQICYFEVYMDHGVKTYHGGCVGKHACNGSNLGITKGNPSCAQCCDQFSTGFCNLWLCT